MPTEPLRPCAVCHALGCRQHQPKPWHQRHTGTRLRGRRLQQERARLFDRNPLCVECLRRQTYVLATVRDHIIPLAEGGTDNDANIQGLCNDCHTAKTQAEAARGRRIG
jgi:5-methylcytosine-specific restriction enzyme A